MDFEVSEVLDNLYCAISDAINFYDDKEEKRAVELCEDMYKLAEELERYEKEIYAMTQPDYRMDEKFEEMREKEIFGL